MRLRPISALLLLLGTTMVGWRWFWGRQRRWGATQAEIARSMPGDDLLALPPYDSTRAITVNAPPDCIYPWLVQMGRGRGGLYSYDFLDRVFGFIDAPSAQEVHPEWQDLRPGDEIPLGRGDPFPVVDLQRNRAFVLGNPAQGWSWSTCMYPREDGTTRLVTRNRVRYPNTAVRLGMVVLDPAASVMVRRWLIVLKERAEKLQRERGPAATPEQMLAGTPSRS